MQSFSPPAYGRTRTLERSGVRTQWSGPAGLGPLADDVFGGHRWKVPAPRAPRAEKVSPVGTPFLEVAPEPQEDSPCPGMRVGPSPRSATGASRSSRRYYRAAGLNGGRPGMGAVGLVPASLLTEGWEEAEGLRGGGGIKEMGPKPHHANPRRE